MELSSVSELIGKKVYVGFNRCNGYRFRYFYRGDYMVFLRYADEADLADITFCLD